MIDINSDDSVHTYAGAKITFGHDYRGFLPPSEKLSYERAEETARRHCMNAVFYLRENLLLSTPSAAAAIYDDEIPTAL